MPAMQRLRAYHLLLAVLVVAAYFTGDEDRLHAWLGYGVAVVILLRLLMVFTGAPQLGLMRFYPHFEGLKLGTLFTHPAISRSLLLGIAICTIGAVGTGVWMDGGRSLGIGGAPEGVARMERVEGPAAADRDHEEDDDGDEGERRGAGHAESDGDEAVGEVHELLANLLLAFVGAHVTYLLLFKRPLARFMLFLPKSTRQ